MQEPDPHPSAGRGRIPPQPPTAVGLMERPEWGLPQEQPREPWWGRIVVGLICLAALILSPFARRTHYDRYYSRYTPQGRGRVPLDLRDDTLEEG